MSNEKKQINFAEWIKHPDTYNVNNMVPQTVVKQQPVKLQQLKLQPSPQTQQNIKPKNNDQARQDADDLLDNFKIKQPQKKVSSTQSQPKYYKIKDNDDTYESKFHISKDDSNQFYSHDFCLKFAVILLIILAAIIFIFSYKILPLYNIIYCNTNTMGEEQKHNCITCPEHGYCEKNKLVSMIAIILTSIQFFINKIKNCEQNYVKQNGKCILKGQLLTTAEDIAKDIILGLATENGKQFCLMQLDADLIFSQKSINQVTQEMENLIKQMQGVKTVQEQQIILTNALGYLELPEWQKNYNFQVDIQGNLIVKKIDIDLFCLLRVHLQKKYKYYIVTMILIMIGSITIIKFQTKRKHKRLAKKLFQTLYKELLQSKDKQIPIQNYMQDYINLTGSAIFSQEIWPEVENMRIRTRSANKILKIQDDEVKWVLQQN